MADFLLTIHHPERKERRVEINVGKTYRIGSHSSCDIVIDQNDVSRSHAVLEVLDEGSFHITDLKSKNGTTLNRRRVESARFGCGDQVGLSSVVLIVVEASETAHESGEQVPPAVRNGSSDDTEQFQREATVEDMVTLLERVAASGAEKSVWSILQWSMERFSLDGALLLHVENGSVAVAGNAGATGDLVRDPEVLREIATAHRLTDELAVWELRIAASDVLVATLGPMHLLVLLLRGGVVAFHDLRAICAALKVSLALADTGISAERTATPEKAKPQQQLTLKEALAQFEKSFLERQLEAADWNQSEVARRLRISRTALFRKVRKYRIRATGRAGR